MGVLNVNNIRSQLDYLIDTKALMKQALIDNGANITDETTFREYVKAIEEMGKVKLYPTKEAMNSDLGCVDGTIALVYNDDLKETKSFDDTLSGGIYLPRLIISPRSYFFSSFIKDYVGTISSGKTITGSHFTLINDTDTTLNIDGYFEANYTTKLVYSLWFKLVINGKTYQYTAKEVRDGYPYVYFYRDDAPDSVNPYFIDGADTGNYTFQLTENDETTGIKGTNDIVKSFILSGNLLFDGIYKFSATSKVWDNARTNLTAVSADVLNASAFGADGVADGILGAPKYIDNNNWDTLVDYLNKFDSLYKSIDTSNITNFYNFHNKTNLNPIVINWINTCNVTDMKNAFQDMTRLRYIETNNWDLSKVVTMHNTFDYCLNLRECNFANKNLSSLENTSNMFYWCRNLTQVTFSNSDMPKLTNASNMFYDCENILHLNMANALRSSVNLINGTYMFGRMNNVETINLQNIGTSNLQSTSMMFSGCKNLTSLNVQSIYNPFVNVRDASNMFERCGKLPNVNFPIGSFDNLVYASNMFRNCTNLSWVNINMTSVENATDMFYMTPKLNNFNIIGNLTNLTNTSNMFYNSGIITNTNTNNTTNVLKFMDMPKLENAYQMFRQSKITNADFGWNFPNLTNADYMLAFCNSLIHINMNNAYLPNLTKLVGFEKCTNLKTFTASNANFCNITELNFDSGYRLENRYGYVENIDVSCSNMDNIELINFNSTNIKSANLSYLYCPNLTNLSKAFMYCNNLVSVNMRGITTTNTNTMSQMFYGCNNLITFDFGDADTSNITTIQGLFDHCHKLENINGMNWNLPNLTTMSSTFSNCNSLTNIDAITFNYPNLTTLAGCFSNTNITKLDMSNANLPMLTTMQGIITNTSNLVSFNLANANLPMLTSLNFGNLKPKLIDVNFDNLYCPNVLNIRFNGCGVNEINLSTVNLPMLNNLFGAFINAQNLQRVIFEDNITCENVVSMSSMFMNCYALTEANFSTWLGGNVTTISGMFNACRNLTSINLCNCDFSKTTSLGGAFSGCYNLITLDMNFNMETVSNIQYTFSHCHNLENIDLSNLTNITCNNFYHTFGSCEKIDTWNISNLNTSGVDSMYHTFWNSGLVDTNQIRNWDMANVINTYNMFTNSKKLVDVNFSNCNFTKLSGMHNMFTNCNNLVSVDFSNCITKSLNNMAWAFYDCYRLQTVNLSGLNTVTITNIASMFSSCTNLHSIDFTGWDVSNVTNLSSMFYRCNKLSNDTIDMVINIVLVANIPASMRNLSNKNSMSPFRDSNITSAKYSTRLEELTAAGWTY